MSKKDYIATEKQGVYVIDGFVIDAFIYKPFKQPEIRIFRKDREPLQVVDVSVNKNDSTAYPPKRAVFVYRYTGEKINGRYEYQFKGVVYD